MERDSRIVSSSETVVATPIAASTATPRLSAPVMAATTTPVITLIIGRTASSRIRIGIAVTWETSPARPRG